MRDTEAPILSNKGVSHTNSYMYSTKTLHTSLAPIPRFTNCPGLLMVLSLTAMKVLRNPLQNLQEFLGEKSMFKNVESMQICLWLLCLGNVTKIEDLGA